MSGPAAAGVRGSTSRRLPGAFWRLWTATIVSYLGDGMRFVALPLLATTVTTDPAQVALVTAAGYLPWLFAFAVPGVVGGLDANRLMVAMNVFRCGIGAVIVVLAAFGATSVAVLAALAALLTIAQIPHDLGANRRLPEILPPAQLVQGNTRLSLGDTIARQLIAPPIGGLLFAVSAVLPLGIDAATFGLAAVVLAFPTARRERSPVARPTRAHREVVSGLRTGLGVVRRCTTLRAQAAVLVVWNLVLGGIFGILVLWATRTLGLGSAEYGLLALGSAVGGLLGALAASAIRRRIGSGRALQLSVVGLMTTLVGMGLTVDPVLAGALFALNGAASVIWNIVVVSLRQSIVPAELLDRVQGVFLTCSRGVQFVGTLLGGVVAAAWGLRAPLLLAAAGLLVLVPFLPALSDRHAVLAERQLRQEVG